MAIIVPIGVDTKGLQRGLTGARGQLARFGKIAALAAGAAALGGLVKTLEVGTRKFIEQEKAVAQTNARLQSTGGIANVTAADIVKLSDAIANKTGIDDDAIHAMSNMILTFTNIRNEVGKNNNIFDRAVQITTDLSVAFEKDLQSSAIMVGKALNDPVRGITALGRAGVQFTEQQKEQIKALVDSGKTLQAQKMILRELEIQVGGSAEAFGTTLPGQLSILKQSFESIAMSVASVFIPRVVEAMNVVKDFLAEVDAQPTLRAKIRFVIDTFANLAWRGISTIYAWWNRETSTVELPARVKIVPPGGRQIAEDFFIDLRPNMDALGNRLGDAVADRFSIRFGDRGGSGLSRELGLFLGVLRATASSLGGQLGLQMAIDLVRGFTRRVAGRILGGLREAFGKAKEIASDVVTLAQTIGFDFIQSFRNIIFDAIGNVIRESLNRAWESVKSTASDIGRRVADAVTPSGRSAKRLKDKITGAVREAVQSARRTLQGLGGEITGLLTEIRARTMTGENFRASGAILSSQRELEDRRLEIEETRLREALDAAEDKTQAQLDLDEFLLNKEITLRDRALADQQAADQAAVDSLVDRFNQGEIAAQQFYDELQGIIGPVAGDNLGEAMGSAFANRFKLAVEEIKAVVADIFAVIGKGEPIGAAAGGAGVGAALKSENQRRFDDAMRVWEQQRDRIQKRIDNARKNAKKKDSPGKETITKEEKDRIDQIIAELNTHRKKKPQRAAYGLALGGILKKTVFAAGEAGPEAVIPLQSQGAWNMLRDAAMASGGNARGGGDLYLTVNAGLGTNPDELSRVIVDSIKRYERRNGVVFSGPLVTATGNAQGQVSTASGATDFNFVRLGRRG